MKTHHGEHPTEEKNNAVQPYLPGMDGWREGGAEQRQREHGKEEKGQTSQVARNIFPS